MKSLGNQQLERNEQLRRDRKKAADKGMEAGGRGQPLAGENEQVGVLEDNGRALKSHHPHPGFELGEFLADGFPAKVMASGLIVILPIFDEW